MKPFRLMVQEKLVESLKGITPANGFTFDLSQSVFRGRAIFGDDDPLPMVSILEEAIGPESDMEPTGGSGSSTPYLLMIQGFAPDDPVNPTDPAHYLLADVKKRLAQEKAIAERVQRVFHFGPKSPTVTAISFGGGVVRPADEISAKAYFWLRLALTLVEDHDNPYVEN